jgi:SAM-dependent methyltransferase
MASFWDDRYAVEHYVFGEAPNAFLARQGALLPTTGRALAVADGEGRNGVWLAQQGLSVLSVDGSAVAQEKAERLAIKRGVSLELALADLDSWDWPEGEMDVVAGIFIQFMDPPGRDRMFQRMIGALKPGGLLLLEGYRPEQRAYGTGGPRDIDKLYTEALLRERFGEMQIVSLDSYDAELSEGPGHDGMSAVIDLVARRRA